VVASIARVETDAITKDDVLYTQAKLLNKPFYYGWCKGSIEPEQILDMIRFAVRRLGIKLLVFDHIQFLIRGFDNVVQQTSKTVRDFKFLSEELGIVTLLIAHPRKVNPNKPMGMYDLRDTSSLAGDCDAMWFIHRRKVPVESEVEGEQERFEWEPETQFYVEAARNSDSGSVMLWFDKPHLRFVELEDHKAEEKKNGKKKKKKKNRRIH